MQTKHISDFDLRKFILSQCFKVEAENNRYLHYFVSPTFTEDYAIQLIWRAADVECFRTSFFPGGNMVKVERAMLERSKIEALLKLLDDLNPKVHLELDNRQGRDGAQIELAYGFKNSKVTYNWWTAETPEEWSELNDASDEVQRLVDIIPFIEIGSKFYTIQSDQNDEDKSILIEVGDEES